MALLSKLDDFYWWEKETGLNINNNRLHLRNIDIENLAKEFGTPLYIYDLEKVKDNYKKVENTLKKHANNQLETRVYYAMKANGASEVLGILKKEDAYVDTSGIEEVKKAILLGYSPEKIIFTGTNFGLDGFEYLAKSGVFINIDSFSQLKRLKPYAPLPLSIRLNPNVEGVGFNQKFDMSGSGAKASRLGIYIDRIIEAFHTARDYGFNPICLHQHVGSNWLRKTSFDTYMQSVDSAIDIVKTLEKDGFNIEMLNLGGGLGVKSHSTYPEFPLEEFAKTITQKIINADINVKCLAIEPGRYIVGNSGILVSTVNMVEKKNKTNFVGVDVGFNAFHHKFMYDIDNTIVNVSKIPEPKEQTYAVVGYLGEQGDMFNENEKLPLTEEGDIIMLYPAGAYCASELAQHHLLPIPKELFLKKRIKNLSLKNYCKACPKSCCFSGLVNISKEEYELILQKTGKKDAFTTNKNGIIQIDNKVGNPCHFLANDGYTCTIQDIKPYECRAYPVYFGKNGNLDELIISSKCPASKFIDDDYMVEAKKVLSNIPLEKRLEYFSINVETGQWE